MLFLWGLEPRNYIWATWAQKKAYKAITPEPYHQF